MVGCEWHRTGTIASRGGEGCARPPALYPGNQQVMRINLLHEIYEHFIEFELLFKYLNRNDLFIYEYYSLKIQ